jgi:hypothetical protein
VRLRGKFDAVDRIGEEAIYLQENKTKGDINEEKMQRQLLFDLQSNFYLIALQSKLAIEKIPGTIRGVRYNVIRRPLSGGRGTIKRHEPTKKNPQGETQEEFYHRLKLIIETEPEYYFMRWKCEFTSDDHDKFRTQFFDPCLESLCDWWDWIKFDFEHPFRQGSTAKESSVLPRNTHYRLPYGVYNVITEGGSSDLDQYLEDGNEVGLQRATTLFRELG